MINVLHVILSFEIGGMEQVVSDLICNIDRSKFNPIVVCLESLGPMALELEKHNITLIRLLPMTPIFSFIFPLRLIRIIREYDIDVIHSHSGCWPKAAVAGMWGGISNSIYTDHGRGTDTKTLIALHRICSVITTRIVGVSEELVNYMSKNIGIPRRKLSCIINGVDDERFAVARKPQKIIADQIGIIARLVPVKDVGTLLRAIKLLHDKGVKVMLTVVGDGPERKMLEELTVFLGIENLVTFLGFRRDIATVLSAIDIFVLSSLSEGTSITLLEAMAAGKPVVVTDVGGNPAIVKSDVNGLVVPPGNPESMSVALYSLMNNQELRVRISLANIEAVQRNYNLRAMAQSYETLYLAA